MRRSSFDGVGLPYIEYSPELFVNAITLGGIRIADVGDGRYAATWSDETGRPRMSVGGRFSPIGMQYRHITEAK